MPAKWGNALGNALRGAGAKFGLGAGTRKHATWGGAWDPTVNLQAEAAYERVTPVTRTGPISHVRNWKGCSYLDTEHQAIEVGDGQRLASCVFFLAQFDDSSAYPIV